jgi:hypothetical protein
MRPHAITNSEGEPRKRLIDSAAIVLMAVWNQSKRRETA